MSRYTLGETSKLIGCSLHIQQPAAANLYGKCYTLILNTVAFWLQPAVMNFDLFPYHPTHLPYHSQPEVIGGGTRHGGGGWGGGGGGGWGGGGCKGVSQVPWNNDNTPPPARRSVVFPNLNTSQPSSWAAIVTVSHRPISSGRTCHVTSCHSEIGNQYLPSGGHSPSPPPPTPLPNSPPPAHDVAHAWVNHM